MRHRLLAAVALCAIIVQPVQAAPPRATVAAWPIGVGLQADPAVRLGVMPNGLRYAIRRNATPPGNASLRLRIDTGSLNEREDQRGLAHFLEHMVFNGSKDVPEGEFVKRLERVGLKFGPDTNASTDFEQTVFKLDLPKTDASTVDTALFLLRQVGDKATLSTAAIDRERGIILAEERTRNSPQLRQAIDELGFTYQGQRLANRIPIGSVDVIRATPRERLVQFYEAYYRPENATLVAVGDFDVAVMEAKIVKQFGDWKGEGPRGVQTDIGTVAKRSREAGLFVDPAMATRTNLIWLRPADLSADSRRSRQRDVIEGLAFAVINRRLERIAAVSSSPPFVAAQAGESQMADAAQVTQMLAIAQPGKWATALSAIESEQRRLVKFGVAKSELFREITNVRTALQGAVAGESTRTSSALAEGLVALVNDDRTPTTATARLALFEEAVAGITPGQVNATLPYLFSGSGPLVYLTSPTAVEGGKPALLAALDRSTKVAVAAPVQAAFKTWPYTSFGQAGQIVERKDLSAISATTVRFANGLRLTVKPTDFRKDQILVQARVGSGRLSSPKSKPPVDWVLGLAVPSGGLSKISAEDMSGALTGKTYAVGFGVEDDAFTLSGATRPADFATQLQVLTAYLAEPGWQPTGLERLRNFSGTIQDQLASTPGGVFQRDSDLLLRSGDERFRTPTREEMAATTMVDVRTLLTDTFARAPVDVTVVGDVTVDEAIRQVAATFGALPPRTGRLAEPGEMALPPGNTGPVTLTHKGRADQGMAFIAWPTQGAFKNLKETRALNVLAAVFQLRLTERIREAEGVSYSPGASHSASDTWDNYGYLFGSVEAPPAALPKFLTTAQSIADDLRNKPVEADELNRALKPMVERIERDRNGNAWWLAQLGGSSDQARVLDSIATQMVDYRSITPAIVQAAARRSLLATKAYKVVVVPETVSK